MFFGEMDSYSVLIFMVIFISFIIRNAFGFGAALLAMPIFALTIGLKVGAPLVASCAIINALIILMQNWEKARFGVAWRLVIFSIPGIFAGLYLLYRLRDAGFTVRVFEAGGDVGGTWYWNRYPGARCDIESMQYSYQFSEELQQEWTWTERYASQPELLSYIEHVVERFDLRPNITFDTRVDAAIFDDTTHQWTIDTSGGETVRARFFILGAGVLSTTNIPTFEDRDLFSGSTFQISFSPIP